MNNKNLKIGQTFINHFNQKCKVLKFNSNPELKPIIAVNLENNNTQYFHFIQVEKIINS